VRPFLGPSFDDIPKPDRKEGGCTAPRIEVGDAPERSLARRDVRLLAPLPRPVQMRDFLCFEAHLANALARGAAGRTPPPIPPVWYEVPVFYTCNRLAIVGPDSDVDLLVVPGTNVFDVIAQTAAQLDSADIWAGRSSVMEPAEQAKHFGEAWERLPKKANRQVTLHVVDSNGTASEFNLGAHVPKLADADVDLIHTLWLDATKQGGVEGLRHKEIVTVALARLAEEMKGASSRPAALERMRSLIGKRLP
jgi:hypothetical protein